MSGGSYDGSNWWHKHLQTQELEGWGVDRVVNWRLDQLIIRLKRLNDLAETGVFDDE